MRKAGIDATAYEAYDRCADDAGVFRTPAVNALDALHALPPRLPKLKHHWHELRLGSPVPAQASESAS